MALPPSLSPVATYFLRADELRLSRPFVAHRLRLFAVELGMKVKGPDAGRFLLSQLQALEAEKAARIPPPMMRRIQPAGGTSTGGSNVSTSPSLPHDDMERALDAVGEKSAAQAAAQPTRPVAHAATTTSHGGASVEADAVDMDKALDAAEAELGKPADHGGAARGPPEPGSMDALLDAAEGKVAPAAAKQATPVGRVELVPASEEEAIRACGLDLYERGRLADKPGIFPSPSISWSVTDAPRVAQCLHAAAVVLDSLKLFRTDLPADLLQFQQAAHRRSAQLASQLAHAFKSSPCIPLEWGPADMRAAVPVKCPSKPTVPVAPPPSAAFPTVPRHIS